MLLHIQAAFECDRCGLNFYVELDTASKLPDGWTIFELAEDALRGRVSGSYSDDNGYHSGGSVQDEKHLCQECTSAVDNLHWS